MFNNTFDWSDREIIQSPPNKLQQNIDLNPPLSTQVSFLAAKTNEFGDPKTKKSAISSMAITNYNQKKKMIDLPFFLNSTTLLGNHKKKDRYS